MKKLVFLVTLFLSTSLTGKGIFHQTASFLNPFANVKKCQEIHYQQQQEFLWAQQAQCVDIVKETKQLCSSITDEYVTEIKCFYGMQYAQTEYDLQEKYHKLLDHLEKLPQQRGHNIDFLGDLRGHCEKLSRYRNYVDSALQTARHQLKTREYEKTADKSAAKKLRQEYFTTVNQAPRVLADIEKIQHALGEIDTLITKNIDEPLQLPPGKHIPIPDEKKQLKQLVNIKQHTLRPSWQRAVTESREITLVKFLNRIAARSGNQNAGNKKIERDKSFDDWPFPNHAQDKKRIKKVMSEWNEAEESLKYETELICETERIHQAAQQAAQKEQSNQILKNFNNTMEKKQQLLICYKDQGVSSNEANIADQSENIMEPTDILFVENDLDNFSASDWEKTLKKRQVKMHPDKRIHTEAYLDLPEEKRMEKLTKDYQKFCDKERIIRNKKLFSCKAAQQEYNKWSQSDRKIHTKVFISQDAENNSEEKEDKTLPIVTRKEYFRRKKARKQAIAGEINQEEPNSLKAVIRNQIRQIWHEANSNKSKQQYTNN